MGLFGALCGRIVLQSTRRASIVACASSNDPNRCWSRHSARKWPLNDSTKPLSVGLPGLENLSCTRCRCAYASSALEMNSGGLSIAICSGTPTVHRSRSRTPTTRSPVREAATSIAGLTRLTLSTIVKTQKRRPSSKPVGQEIEAPPLLRALGDRGEDPRQADPLAVPLDPDA